jgi:hypothetical protein
MTVSISESTGGRRLLRGGANHRQRAWANGFVTKIKKQPRPAVHPTDDARLREQNEPATRTAVGIGGLSSSKCHWPLWGDSVPLPPVGKRLYCGAKPVDESPYCQHHHARSLAREASRSIRGGA